MELEGLVAAPQKKIPMTDIKRSEIVALFMLALIWTVGGLMEEDKRKHFNEFLNKELKALFE
jgi:hypothetical protein